VDMNLWLPDNVGATVELSTAILRVFRDEAERKDRQKARLMWLVEAYGTEKFGEAVKAEVASYGRGIRMEAAQPHEDAAFERRSTLGVGQQSDPALARVGIHVPAGRLSVAELRDLAGLADAYSAGEVRLTVEQNALLPNVPREKLAALLAEPALTLGRLSVDPGNVLANMVSCTGSQFCPLAIIETKTKAERVMGLVDERVESEKPIRVHWTGCPNSCGQVQAADIGLMGAPAKRANAEGKMKAVAGVNIYVGGTIGEGGHLAMEPAMKGVPIDDEAEIADVLAKIMVDEFGAKRR